MQQQFVGERHLLSPAHGSSGAENRISEILTRIERNLNEIAEGLSLIGLKRCSWCRNFFKCAESGALFDGEELVCFGCIPRWWPRRREELGLTDRREVESKLVFWLRNHHQAEVVKQSGKLAGNQMQTLRMVATCLQCRGEGKLLGDKRCRYCDGPGTVWVIVPGWDSMNTDPALLANWSPEFANQT